MAHIYQSKSNIAMLSACALVILAYSVQRAKERDLEILSLFICASKCHLASLKASLYHSTFFYYNFF